MPTYFSRTDTSHSFPQGGQPAVVREFFLTDVNGDGVRDAVLTYEYYPVQNQPIGMRVLLGTANGGFTDGTSQVFGGSAPAFIDARGHAAADFNGDGRTDLFFANTGFDTPPFPGELNGMVLSSGATLTNAAGNLPAFSDYSTGASAADINGDGRPDILVATIGARGPYFLMGQGGGQFVSDGGRLPPEVAPAAGQFATPLLFDANNDGRPDVFLGGDGDSRILLNDGTGRFAVPAGMTYPVAGSHNVVDAVAADLNGDGLKDVVVTVAYGSFTAGGLQLLMNQGNGIFYDETFARVAGGGMMTSGGWVYRTEIADFNGDGAPDLMLSGGTNAQILVNDGEGRFVRMPDIPGDIGALDRPTSGDINGDGRADIVVRRGDLGTTEFVSTYLSVNPGPSQTGDDGPDGLMGGAGADSLLGQGGNDAIVGAAGDDFIRGGEGDDQILGGAGFDYINGNQGNDLILAGSGPDWALGGQGADLVFGGDGADIVNGNIGADTCDGGAGEDSIRGGQNDDLLLGGDGNDWLIGDLGADTLTGGAGADRFHVSAGVDQVTDFNLAGGDRVELDPGMTYTVTQAGADAVIDFSGGARMILLGVQASALTGGWIVGG